MSPPSEAPSGASSARLIWDASGSAVRHRLEPVTCGLPWAPGLLHEPSRLALTTAARGPRLLQARALEHWPDGSVRWTLLDFLLDTAAGPHHVVIGSGVDGPGVDDAGAADNQSLRVESSESGAAVEVDTGAARFRLEKGHRFPFVGVDCERREILDADRGGLFAIDEIDNPYDLRTDQLQVVESGPVRTAVRLSGRLLNDTADPLADVTADIHFHAGFPGLTLEIAVTNRRDAGHLGGRWSLGSRGSIYLRELSLTLALRRAHARWEEATPTVECSPETGSGLERYSLPFSVYQDSSGGENWRSSNHVNRRGEVPLAMRGYRLRSAAQLEHGRRAEPIVRIARGDVALIGAIDRFWQNLPKTIEADRGLLSFGLFPSQSADVHELQGGERKTQTVRLAFEPREPSESLLAWMRSPLLVQADPEWYAGNVAIPFLVPEARDPNKECQRLVDAGIEGPRSFFAKREVVDEYGWRHFGELYADHEAVGGDLERPLVSHYNNQYDAIAGFAAHFMRSGDGRWFQLMDELARHVADIDLYHTARDKSAYNHGHFWHTVHYIDAGTSTHRSYPKSEGVGGGPSSGHLYTTGLLLHYLIAGHSASRDAVAQLGQYVIDADDGRRTVFRFLDRGYTGHISLSAFDGYHGPGRASANSLNALIDAHRLTGEKRFLAKAEQLVRRCIHPEDDLEARRLTYVEGRWFYTMFLASLGKYLDHKALLDQNDGMYAYAEAALLHYAAWALEHEYPYLEKPDILEFPTETWAAQDMRKSEIFRIAARHTDGEKRRRYLERARWFFDASVRQLEEHPTQALCRPLVLLARLGYGQAWTDQHPDDRAPRAVESWKALGPPRPFVTQKQRAKERLVRLSAAGLLGLAALGLLRWIL